MTVNSSVIETFSTNSTNGPGILNLNGSVYRTQFVGSGVVINVDETSTLELKGAASPIPSATVNLFNGGTLEFINGTPTTLNPDSIVNALSGFSYSTTGDISNHFTFTGTQAAPTSITAIPESSSLCLLGLGAVALVRRRRR